MIEFVFITVFLFMLIAIYIGYPFYRHYRNYQTERAMLEKKYNRLWRSRRDLLGHVDWAISRQDPPREIEMMGREVERMDREM